MNPPLEGRIGSVLILAAKPSGVCKTCFVAFPENLLSGCIRKHSSMTINTGVGVQTSCTQKYSCGCIMHHDKEKYIKTGYAQGNSTEGTMRKLSGIHDR